MKRDRGSSAVGERIHETRVQFLARREKEGCQIIKPADNELLIDIDSDEHLFAFEDATECLERNGVKIEIVDRWESKSGYPCEHIKVRMPFNLDPWQRIAWQAAMGSDPIRELLSAVRMQRGEIHPSVFIEPKAEPVRHRAKLDDLEDDIPF